MKLIKMVAVPLAAGAMVMGSAIAASASPTAPTIYPGSSYQGSKVKCIQRAINWHFGINIPVDGYYGSTTVAYVKRIQGESPAITQDGITGKLTGNKLMGSLDNAGLHGACYPLIPTTY